MGISVVIPLFNSHLILPKLVERFSKVLETLGEPYELILINDNGPDLCWEAIKQFAAQRRWIRGICMMRNYGQHNALLCGIRVAVYDKLVTMDDDLQHPPEQIPILLELLNHNIDVVYGTPQNEKQGLLRTIVSRTVKLALYGIVGIKLARNISAFRVFRTQLRDAFIGYQTSFVSIDVLLTWATTRFTSINIPFDKRHIGVSNYTFRKLIRHALDLMTGFSTVPLKFASIMGFAFAAFGIVILFYIIGRYLLSGNSIPGFPFLGSIIAIFSGAQLFALGVIGEYLARIHFHTMRRPVYVTRQTVNF